MCPFCIATVAWVAAGAASTGGVSAAVVNTLRKNGRSVTEITQLHSATSKKNFEENRYVTRRIDTW
jgi:hypothetical protein